MHTHAYSGTHAQTQTQTQTQTQVQVGHAQQRTGVPFRVLTPWQDVGREQGLQTGTLLPSLRACIAQKKEKAGR